MTSEQRIKQVQHHEQCDSRFASVCGDSQRCSCGLDWLLAELNAAIEHARVTGRDVLTLTGRKVALEAELDAARAREAKLREALKALIKRIRPNVEAAPWVVASIAALAEGEDTRD